MGRPQRPKALSEASSPRAFCPITPASGPDAAPLSRHPHRLAGVLVSRLISVRRKCQKLSCEIHCNRSVRARGTAGLAEVHRFVARWAMSQALGS